MTDTDRNTRTLIVAFTIAIFTLIPLRFVEVGQQVEQQMNNRVLGESVMLPKAVVGKNAVYVGLEAPYRQQFEESKSCILKSEASSLVKDLQAKLAKSGLTTEQKAEISDGIRVVQKNTCKK